VTLRRDSDKVERCERSRARRFSRFLLLQPAHDRASLPISNRRRNASASIRRESAHQSPNVCTCQHLRLLFLARSRGRRRYTRAWRRCSPKRCRADNPTREFQSWRPHPKLRLRITWTVPRLKQRHPAGVIQSALASRSRIWARIEGEHADVFAARRTQASAHCPACAEVFSPARGHHRDQAHRDDWLGRDRKPTTRIPSNCTMLYATRTMARSGRSSAARARSHETADFLTLSHWPTSRPLAGEDVGSHRRHHRLR